MQVAEKIDKISPEEYLQDELLSEFKHELIDGEAYAMSGAAANHERIAGNFYAELRNHLKGSPCEPFGSDMKVRVSNNFFYPDVIVDCEFDDSQPYYTDSPVIIVEVLSRSTRRIDRTIKRQQYLGIPTLQEYVLIEQDVVDIEVVRRSDDWRSKHYYMGDEMTFDSIGLTLPVEEIYLRVQNEDVVEYLAKKEEAARLAAEAEQQTVENPG
jgi:Uma2 family endonuclease